MKKILLLSFLYMSFSLNLFSQEVPKYIYAEIVGESKLFSKKVTVEIDYGQETSFFVRNKIVNEDGTNKKFNSMVDAMNYMGAYGWEFQQAYVVTIGNQNVYHWLMRKEFTDLDADIQDDIKKYLPTKKDLK